jgi:DNA adenine methylase
MPLINVSQQWINSNNQAVIRNSLLINELRNELLRITPMPRPQAMVDIINALSDLGNREARKHNFIITPQQEASFLNNYRASPNIEAEIEYVNARRALQPYRPPTPVGAGLSLDELTGGSINPPYGRLGGKSRLKLLILEHFPANYENMTYVEPFFGAGSVYFAKTPSVKEVINDLDKNMVILMRGFKKYDGNDISKTINGDHTKAEFRHILLSNPKGEYGIFIKTLLLTKLSFFGKMTNFSNQRQINSNYGDKYNERMKDTIITNKDYREVVAQYDSPNTFFYFDPPYSMSKSERYYDGQYILINEFFDVLDNIKGKFLFSYDDDDEAKRLFKNYNIKKVKTLYSGTQNIGVRTKTEILVSNF